MEILKQYLPLLIPALVLQFGLMLAALIHLIRHKKTRNLNVGIWAVIIIIGEILGPVLYLLIGREED
jgi:hypothetical protein